MSHLFGVSTCHTMPHMDATVKESGMKEREVMNKAELPSGEGRQRHL